MSLTAGARLGPYEIVSALGAGGMGEVYLATDTRLGRDVAIKVLPPDLVSDPERLARFEREAKAVSALNHPHIVTLYEVGRSDAGPYLVLERIEGRSLREVLDAGPLPVRRILTLGAQIAEGIAKAHAAGIVHRDLKPGNVMVTDDGFAKILDFGLAKLAWPESGARTVDDITTIVNETSLGRVLGTPGYLSPEQASANPPTIARINSRLARCCMRWRRVSARSNGRRSSNPLRPPSAKSRIPCGRGDRICRRRLPG